MRENFQRAITVALVTVVALVAAGCGGSTDSALSSELDDPGRGLPKRPGRPTAPGVEVTPVAGQPTPDPGELKTVLPIVFSSTGTVIATDTNTGCTASFSNLEPASLSLSAVYVPSYEPTLVAGKGFTAAGRAASAWSAVDLGKNDLQVSLLSTSNSVWAPPGRDGYNLVGWCKFDKPSPTAPTYAGAIFLWHDPDGQIHEWDLYLNLNLDWAVNNPITRGETRLGTYTDVQAVITHELGHLLGLADTTNGNASLGAVIRPGELNKQTLATAETQALQSRYGD